MIPFGHRIIRKTDFYYIFNCLRNNEFNKPSNRACEFCETFGAKRVAALTRYLWNGNDEDPNRDLHLCNNCELEYVDKWNEQWREYYSDKL